MADTTITPASPLTWPANLAVPTPGDNIKAAVAPGAVRPAYQALLNAAASAQARTYGRPSQIQIEGESNTSLVIYPVGAFTILDAGVWKTYTNTDNTSVATGASATTVDPVALTGGLTANSRYWVYLKKPTGADPFDVLIERQVGAGTFPDRNLSYRAADQSATLISTFYVDHAGDILPYRQNDGRFSYSTRTLAGGGVRGNLILDAGHAVGATTVALGDSQPGLRNTTVNIDFRVEFGGGTYNGTLYEPLSGVPLLVIGGGGAGDDQVAQAGIPDYYTRPTATGIDYAVSAAGVDAYMWVSGFRLW